MTKKIYLETLKSVLGRSILHYSKVQHKLHGHITGFQDFILVVNSERLSEFLMSTGTMF